MKPRLNAPCQPHTGGDNPQPTDSAAANAAGPLGGSQPREHWREATIVEVARRRAATQPEQVAFTFLVDGEHQEERWAFAELDRRAKAIAAELRSRLTGKPDSRCIDGPEAPPRALIMLEPGAGYITTLFGCLYAGVVPVPVYPPDPFRIAQTLPRLQAIVGSAACDLAISSEGVLGGADSVLRRLCPGGAVAVEQVADAGADSFQPTHTGPGGLALLQYTSGTTGEPRGVPVTHANLIDNLRGMERLLDVDDALAVQWLPPYHDLGLIGGVFLPLYAGRPVVLMSPLDFMRRPARWLQAISRCRATTSAGPNFAYEHCLRKISDADCEGLDLSSWRVAASGAEPVRAATIERFCERFGRYGFRREAFVPAYGMAETTLMVSISPVGTPPTVVEVDPRALAESRVEPLPGGRPIVGCGPAGPGVEVRVVDPNTGQQTTGVGEIWVRGASVAAGYWRRPELTAERFDQTLRGAMGDEQRGFFRTGDLGFLRGGELFLVGRRKELIILAGRNFYPHDIEQAVQAAHPAFKAGGGAAVAVDQANEERLAVFQEVQRPRKQDLGELLSVARRVALEETGQEPLRVVLLPVGELPKTSSGKTRRGDCLALHQTAALTTLAEWPAAGGNAKNPAGTPAQTEPGQTQPTQTQPTQSEPPQTETEQWLAALWADALGTAEVGRGDSFFALGGRSLQVTQMLSGVAERTGLILPLATLIDEPTLGGLAAHID
ncbi:MAG: AMP-binding protein, partial [Planctomycetota bacterium]